MLNNNNYCIACDGSGYKILERDNEDWGGDQEGESDEEIGVPGIDRESAEADLPGGLACHSSGGAGGLAGAVRRAR